MTGWMRKHAAAARQTVRVTVGSGVAFALYASLHLPQGYWAVFTVIIVMQGSIGGTLGASLDRMVGTLAGAVVGGAAAALRPPGDLALGLALVASIAVTGLMAGVRANLKVAPVTAAIMLLSSTVGMSPESAALYRVVEIALGGLIGVLASRLILPARSQSLVLARIADVLIRLRGVMEPMAQALERAEPFDASHAHAGLRSALGAVEAAMVDAERERAARLADHAIPAAVPRTLWRVRNDVVSVGRAASIPPPAPAAEALGPAAAALLRAQADFLVRCGAALTATAEVDRDGLATAHDAFAAAFGDFRARGGAREMSFESAGRIFGLAFALESLHHDLNDFGDRVDDVAHGRPRATTDGATRRGHVHLAPPVKTI